MDVHKKLMDAVMLKWIGRIFAIVLFLFWGTFFIEHIAEWFLLSDKGFPPLFVWVAEVFHFVMLVGLFMMIKWDKIGTIIMIIGSIVFFGVTSSYTQFPYIALINLIPIVSFVGYWLLSRGIVVETKK